MKSTAASSDHGDRSVEVSRPRVRQENRGARGQRERAKEGVRDRACEAASIIASRSPSLIDPSVEKDAPRRVGRPSPSPLRSLVRSPSSARALRYICSCFSRKQVARGRLSVARMCSLYYVRSVLSLLRPCGAADRRMRFSRAPAYPSRNYLGRESSSLPRSFPSLLAILRGCSAAVRGRRAAEERGKEIDRETRSASANTIQIRAASDSALFICTSYQSCVPVASSTLSRTRLRNTRAQCDTRPLRS